MLEQELRRDDVTEGDENKTFRYFNEAYETSGLIAEDEETGQWICRATHRSSGQLYAVKHLQQPKWVMGLDGEEPLEARILALVQQKDKEHHLPDCFIRYNGFYADGPAALLFTEYCAGGSLAHRMANYSARGPSVLVPEDFAWHVFRQMASALAHLQRENVVHRNVQPAHMLLTWEDEADQARHAPHLKLAGFGLAACTRSADFDLESYSGTVGYQPPDIPNNGHGADIWGLGATIHEPCLRRLPSLPSLPPQQRWRRHQRSWATTTVPTTPATTTPPNDSYIGSSTAYSLALQDCMAAALRWRASFRPTAAALLDKLAAACPPEFETPNPLPKWATQAQSDAEADTDIEADETLDEDQMDLGW